VDLAAPAGPARIARRGMRRKHYSPTRACCWSRGAPYPTGAGAATSGLCWSLASAVAKVVLDAAGCRLYAAVLYETPARLDTGGLDWIAVERHPTASTGRHPGPSRGARQNSLD